MYHYYLSRRYRQSILFGTVSAPCLSVHIQIFTELKSGVSSSFLPGKMNRHRITRTPDYAREASGSDRFREASGSDRFRIFLGFGVRPISKSLRSEEHTSE